MVVDPRSRTVPDARESVRAADASRRSGPNGAGRPPTVGLPVVERAGCFGRGSDSTLIEPSMMPALIVSSSPCSVGATLLLEVVERRDADAVVLERADVGRRVELRRCRAAMTAS